MQQVGFSTSWTMMGCCAMLSLVDRLVCQILTRRGGKLFLFFRNHIGSPQSSCMLATILIFSEYGGGNS